jgi:hypothetical protein
MGTSENAAQIQIRSALIAMPILRYLQLKSTFGWNLSNLVALLRQQLFVHRDLMKWIDDPQRSCTNNRRRNCNGVALCPIDSTRLRRFVS